MYIVLERDTGPTVRAKLKKEMRAAKYNELSKI
jgi:hypothetical protein